MPLTALLILSTLVSASPRSSAAVKQREAAKAGPMGLAADLTLSLTARPEHSKGGSDLMSQLGLRGAYVWTMGGRRGLTLGGEAAVRALNPGGLLYLRSPLAETDGSAAVGSEVYTSTLQLGGIVGYRFATRNVGLTPHLSLGMLTGFSLVHLYAPGNDSWRPRVFPGVYGGGGLIGNFFFGMLRLDAAVGFTDGRPDYRFDTGLGVMF